MQQLLRPWPVPTSSVGALTTPMAGVGTRLVHSPVTVLAVMREAAEAEVVTAAVVAAAEATGVVARVGGRAGAGVECRAATRAASRAVETAGTAGQS